MRFPNGSNIWFLRFDHTDFTSLQIPVTSEMQKFIACFETLAQMAILLIFSRNSPGFRFPLRIPSLIDNSGTESGGIFHDFPQEWIQYWRSLQYCALYQVWNFIYPTLQAIATTKPML